MSVLCRVLFISLFFFAHSPAWADSTYDKAYDAGYSWAQDKGFTDARDCENDDNPFVDGCEAWANEYEDGYTEAKDKNYDDTADCTGTKAEIAGCEATIDESD